MTFRDGRVAFQMLDEVVKARGVARQSGFYQLYDDNGNTGYVRGHELATGEKAKDIKRKRAGYAALGTALGTGAGALLGAASGGDLESVLAMGAGGALAGGISGYAGGNQLGWEKARGHKDRGTSLYDTRENRKKGIRAYQDKQRRAKNGRWN